MTREDTLALLREHTKTDSLLKHAYGVEAAMRAYARKLGGDEEAWGVAGLIHDFDYEQNPDPEHHPEVGARILEERGYPAEVVYSVRAHAEYLNLPRNDAMSKTLFAVDELVGFIVAVALVRPSKSVMDVEVSSVKKKMKQKSFAAAVSRDDIVRGAAELGVSLDEHLQTVVDALKGIADELGLA
ncbi:MAG: HAD family hydrolase [Armatimonadetes bacterium CG_4_10_14_0_8_um_filter_66_14]|nr:HDIG domain-containing protein [Armatimonadota bacterium]PIU93500.1 MAG: HAD family hydrolase [Armatimonadetes bacterium CG06_land_8_20_14_3_00_66_21]PIX45551.1 MAG: HAD family hydrolase [Armatimonadetes bacterium CG_4_8_14_3_um_filter_66_20]PIZ48032.1 MAG: HAD family hydrolase [Armatimonadetes bacterium CG_4_10_14_0_8_um_filter_66_14]NCO89964.1 HDIG domain-containing protein [Armatimonadota bacterium]